MTHCTDRSRFAALATAALLFAAPIARADEALPSKEVGLELSGLSQNDLVVLQTPRAQSSYPDSFDFAAANLLTLNVRNAKSSAAKIEGSFDLWLLSGVYADAYRRADSSAGLPLPGMSALFHIDISKLYASLYLRYADLSVGRQIISLGRGLVFSPIDVFSSINLSDLTFRRHGSDIVRLRLPFGALSGADFIATVASRARGETVAAKAYANFAGWDAAAVGIYKEKAREAIAGLTFKGDLIAGLYGELVEHWIADSTPFFRGMAGADYSINNTWFFAAEYLFNEKRADPSALTQLAAGELGMPYTGRQYLFGSVRYAVSELMWVSLSGIGALEEKAGFLTGQWYYNVLQNADFSVFVRYIRGNLLPVGNAATPDLEYGLRLEVAF
jgi:hypothetical protein